MWCDNNGQQPVPDDTMVIVEFVNGDRYNAPADFFNWKITEGFDRNILRYKLGEQRGEIIKTITK